MVDQTKQIVKSLMDSLGIQDAEISVTRRENTLFIEVKTNDEYSLIGRENERFEAFSHILKRMIAKNHGEETRVVIDVNGERARNEERIKNKALMMAERAKSFKIDVELEPMTSYERMIVHSHLEGMANIRTESVGEGRDRRLIIRFVETI